MTSTIISIPRETVEFLPVLVEIDDVKVVTGVEFCITENSDRPVTWVAAVTRGSDIGVIITTLDPGLYHIFARATASPDFAVIDSGFFYIT